MKDAFYFPHDSNAKDDPKCSMLIEQLGLEGYGIYWVLVETLRDQPNYRYPLSMLSIIARKYNTTAEKVRVVVGNYGLFSVTADEFFLSESLCRRMERVESMREANRQKGLKSGEVRRLLAQGKITVVEPELNSGSAVVEPGMNKRKEIKGKEIKEKKDSSTPKKRTIVDEYHDLYQAHYNQKPLIDGKVAKILNDIAKSIGDNDAVSKLKMFFADTNEYVIKSCHAVEMFRAKINSYVLSKPSTPKPLEPIVFKVKGDHPFFDD